MKERSDYKYHGSLMYRTWLYFVGITIVLLAVLWTTEVIFFKAYYQRMKEHEIEKASARVVDRFTGVLDGGFWDSVENAVYVNNMMFVMFALDEGVPFSSVTKSNVHTLLYCDPINAQPDEDGTDSIGEQAMNFMPEAEYFRLAAEKDGEAFSYRVRRDRHDSYTLVVGSSKPIAAGTVYFYTATAIAPMDITTALLANQLVLVTCVCIIVSVLLSYAFSKSITRPITEFAATAKQLGKGKKVVFESSGYAEFDELAKALNHSTEELEKTEKLRRDFLANVSHDLRTPLTMVKAYAEMIRDISGKDEVKRAEHCRVIIDEVDRLTLLVNDLLDLSKLQAGTREPQMSAVDLSALTRGVLERFSILSEQNGYKFELELDEDCTVSCDERMVEQIFYNLIGNAVSYTGEDKRVIVRVKRKDGKVRAEISDTGRGIAPSERDKVWDRYYRSSQSKRAVVGSGIGLSIVKSLLIVHNAEYGIDSVINNGTTFWFELPYLDVNAEETADEKPKRKKS